MIRWKAEAFGMELVDQALMLSTLPLLPMLTGVNVNASVRPR